MPILDFLFVAGISTLLGLTLIKTLNGTQQKQRLERAFYYLLEAGNGRMSLIQLAVEAKVDAETTKQFLDAQIKLFNAEPEVDEDGDTFYRFPKLRKVTEEDYRPHPKDEW